MQKQKPETPETEAALRELIAAAYRVLIEKDHAGNR